MASRELSHAKVMLGRVVTITFNKANAEALSVKGLKDGVVSFAEEIKETIAELEDGNEIIESFGRKYTIEITISELDTSDMSAVDGSDELIIATASGGGGGIGRTLTVSSLDDCKTSVDGLKTKIVCRKSIPEHDSPGFVVADISA